MPKLSPDLRKRRFVFLINVTTLVGVVCFLFITIRNKQFQEEWSRIASQHIQPVGLEVTNIYQRPSAADSKDLITAADLADMHGHPATWRAVGAMPVHVGQTFLGYPLDGSYVIPEFDRPIPDWVKTALVVVVLVSWMVFWRIHMRGLPGEANQTPGMKTLKR